MSTIDVATGAVVGDGTAAVDRLRNRIRLNAAFSITSGLLTIVLAGWIADQLGTDRSGLVRIAGAALIAYGADLALTARMRWSRLSPAAVLIVAADLLWVLGTIAVLALGLVDPTGGRVLLAAIGVVVLDIALLQATALATARRATPVR